ncbi:MAG: Bro-N domain-containing protein [Candidatus Komeilibacteria bacterium]|nr:Bro-N domain-containing protein [Candidatus Komeilibacteria bacterium]
MPEKRLIKSNELTTSFDNAPVRRAWDAEKEQWFFAIIDVVEVLSESSNPSGYIKDMRRRDKELSKGWGQIATPLTIKTRGGKQKVNCANVEGILRIIQSIPSKKAEPFKIWLAKVGYERLQETIDPELAVNRARGNWQHAGRSEKWIEQRMRGQETRNKLTDYWQENGVQKGLEYAQLTDIIHQEWSGLTTKQHKRVKNLKGQNLRDNMTEAELIFTALAELSTNQIAKSDEAKGFTQNAKSAQKGGRIAGNARQALEEQTKTKVVSSQNFLPPKRKIKKLRS